MNPERMFLDWCPLPDSVLYCKPYLDRVTVPRPTKPNCMIGPHFPMPEPEEWKCDVVSLRAVAHYTEMYCEIQKYGWHEPTRTALVTDPPRLLKRDRLGRWNEMRETRHPVTGHVTGHVVAI